MSYDSIVNRGEYLSAHYLAERLPKDLKAAEGLLARWAAAETARKREYEKAVAAAERAGADPKSVPEPVRTPRQGLRALRTPYFAERAACAQFAAARDADPQAPVPADWVERRARLDGRVLEALGFDGARGAPRDAAPEQQPPEAEPLRQPLEQQLTVRHSEREHTMRVAHAEPGIVAVSCGWTATPDAALDPGGAGALLHPVQRDGAGEIADAKGAADFLFGTDEPPRHVLLLCGGVVVLADRLTWSEGRYLAISLDAALDRMDDSRAGELDTVAALLSADALRPPEDGGLAPLAQLVDKSAKHAVGVSTELREGVRKSVELIANEVLARLREQGATLEEVDDPQQLAKQLTRESLRYVYRLLFLLYAEARPELGILPSNYPEYEAGYGLQRLGELAVRDLVGEQSRRGFHLYESLDLLCSMVEQGHRPYGSEEKDRLAEAADVAAQEAEAEADRLLEAGQLTAAEHSARRRQAKQQRKGARSDSRGLRFEPLRSELFSPAAISLIGPERLPNPRHEPAGNEQQASGEPEFYDTRLRNETLHQVLRHLMLTQGRKGSRGGFISYAQLGISQLGAVYEGLMSYTGRIADQDLYEVAKDGDPSDGSWMVPASRADQYADEVFVLRRNEHTGAQERVRYERGTFVYRLAGRDRQTSASYYTPDSLTQVTVELALRERLTPDTPARELLEWTICEPALGSGAFLNEAIEQVAEEYLSRRERELGQRIHQEDRRHELQKAKAYIALHNAYGVDLNATAVELAEVSLWLNTMHPGMQAPWYGLHLRRGNSLVGAGRRVYESAALHRGQWLRKKDTLAPTELPFRDGPLPDGAVHHFLLPAGGWGAVAGEKEARDLAPEQAHAMKVWRRGIQKPPSKTRRRGTRASQVQRLQEVARRAEFLWRLVAQRLELSERDISRRIDVWGADWLQHPGTAVDKNKILDDLLAVGTPYWRLKTVMDAWCALWFWPLDEVGLLDGTAPQYEQRQPASGADSTGQGDGPADNNEDAAAAASVGEAAAPAPAASASADQLSEQGALFADPAGEQLDLLAGLAEAFGEESGEANNDAESGVDDDQDDTSDGSSRSTKKNKNKKSGEEERKRKSEMPGTRHRQVGEAERPVIPLKNLDDWIDFAEAVLGRSDAQNTFIERFTELDELSRYEDVLPEYMGMDSAQKLHGRFPWLDVVEEVAGSNESGQQTEGGEGFFHWELQFAHIFTSDKGGFDLQVGNPPWVRPRWEEDAVLAERDPWFKLAEKPDTAVIRERKARVLAEDESALPYFLGELTRNTGMVEMLSSADAFPLLAGTQPNLYRAFMCMTWRHPATSGVSGLVHPNTHLDGVAEGELRAAAYHRLRLHAGFVNAANWAFEATRTTEFGMHIYGERHSHVGFSCLSQLTAARVVPESLDHDGSGEVPGQKHEGKWDVRPHAKRVVEVNDALLEQWRDLVGAEDLPVDQVPLLRPITVTEQGAVAALSSVQQRLGSREMRISSGYHEKGAKESGVISWNTTQVESLNELVLQGTYFSVATPFVKQPDIPCRKRSDWSGWDLTDLPTSLVPRSNYVRECTPEEYRAEQSLWIDCQLRDELAALTRDELVARCFTEQPGMAVQILGDSQADPPVPKMKPAAYDKLLNTLAQRRYTEFYRLTWRRMIDPKSTERSLFAALMPPGPAHVNTVHTIALRDAGETALNAGFWASLPLDYLLRITGRSDLQVTEAQKMPAPDPQHPLSEPLLLRTLRLNCLTDAYAPLWQELYNPAWRNDETWAVEWPELDPLAERLTPTWKYGTPLRTEYERRAALVELDALVAVWLGITADQLAAIYKSRYPILADREARMWFDARGRQMAADPYAYGYGQTKQDFLDFQAFDNEERATLPEGYTAPFYKADREREMRAAHAVFAERFQRAVERGEYTPEER